VFILFLVVFRHRLRKILTLISEALAALAILILYLENAHSKAIVFSQGIFATIFAFNMALCLIMGACLMCSWNKEIDLDDELAKNDDEAKAMEEAAAGEGGNLTAVVPTPFGNLASNAAHNNTDRALAADGPSIEENKKEEEENNWAIEDAKKAVSDPKETGGTMDKQNSKTENGASK
jgi:hypothetical protein